ncbi:MAG: ankyrin repeat domain-containing protein, partial [Rickettsiaceae bacterium]|nr:ankyrin repeat domain-containing protein [Rickettsiaceae bacterium]
CNKRNIDVAKFLIENGADIKEIDRYGNSLLHNACNKRNIDVAKFLIENGADIKEIDRYGNSLLYNACNKRNIDVAKFLIENGADVNERDQYGDSLLSIAVTHRNLDTARLLVESGADINERDENGHSLLHKTIVEYDLDCAELLVELGAKRDVDISMLKYFILYGEEDLIDNIIRTQAERALVENDQIDIHLTTGKVELLYSLQFPYEYEGFVHLIGRDGVEVMLDFGQPYVLK